MDLNLNLNLNLNLDLRQSRDLDPRDWGISCSPTLPPFALTASNPLQREVSPRIVVLLARLLGSSGCTDGGHSDILVDLMDLSCYPGFEDAHEDEDGFHRLSISPCLPSPSPKSVSAMTCQSMDE